MSISRDKYLERMAVITYMENEVIKKMHEIYDRKSNILQCYFGFECEPILVDGMPSSYTDNTFTKGDKVFLDVDDALEYALEEDK